MSGVFISYRREDTAYIAGRLHDRLAATLGNARIFRDIDDIAPGSDFTEKIREAVGSCAALIAVIGEEWLTTQEPSGRRRLDNPDDWVRVEILAALERDILVVPVLVAGATMPNEADLPGDLRALARRNALTLSDERWSDELQPLVKVLDKALRRSIPRDDADQPCSRSNELMPPPALLQHAEALPMVGRRTELVRLAAACEAAAAGSRRTVFVAGEPGAGKSRLVTEAAKQAYRNGVLVLAGRCDDGMAVPYQPFLDALRHFVDHSCDCHLAPRLGRWPGELTRMVPEIGSRIPDLPPPLSAEPETERYRLFDAVASWLAAASAVRPVVLVLDDLQWATKPTLLLLRHILRSPENIRLLAMGTYRDSEVLRGHPLADLMADLRHDEAVAQISLGGLNVGDVRQLVAAITGGRLRLVEIGPAPSTPTPRATRSSWPRWPAMWSSVTALKDAHRIPRRCCSWAFRNECRRSSPNDCPDSVR